MAAEMHKEIMEELGIPECARIWELRQYILRMYRGYAARLQKWEDANECYHLALDVKAFSAQVDAANSTAHRASAAEPGGEGQAEPSEEIEAEPWEDENVVEPEKQKTRESVPLVVPGPRPRPFYLDREEVAELVEMSFTKHSEGEYKDLIVYRFRVMEKPFNAWLKYARRTKGNTYADFDLCVDTASIGGAGLFNKLSLLNAAHQQNLQDGADDGSSLASITLRSNRHPPPRGMGTPSSGHGTKMPHHHANIEPIVE